MVLLHAVEKTLENSDYYFTAESMIKDFGIKRTSQWSIYKMIKKLRYQGYIKQNGFKEIKEGSGRKADCWIVTRAGMEYTEKMYNGKARIRGALKLRNVWMYGHAQ